MPIPSPFHPRTSELCTSLAWKEWAGYFAVCAYDTCHVAEYFALRQTAGLIDVSPLYKYELRGPGAAELLARMTVRDARKMKVGRVTYTVWCDDDGKVLDDGTITRLDDEHFRLTAAEPSLRWMQRHSRGLEVELEDSSDRLASLAVQGPTSRAALQAVTDADLDSLRFFHATPAKIRGLKGTRRFQALITRTGYTGDLGYEVWVDPKHALTLYDALLAQAPEHGIRPVGLDALDMARIEAGFVLSGVDYFPANHCVLESRKCTPYELGFEWMVRLDREPFTGQAALRAAAAKPPTQALVGLEIDVTAIEKLHDAWGIPIDLPYAASREPVPVYAGGRQVGYASSRAFSPTCKKYLALAWVEGAHTAIGSKLTIEVTVEHERKTVGARVAARPFFDPERKKSCPDAAFANA